MEAAAHIADLELALQRVADHVGPAVVGLRRGWSGACGTVIAPGRVLTNAHNLRSDEITVTFADGHTRSGTATAWDPDSDLAVIDVDTGGVEPIAWERAGAGQVSLGRAVLALSNPGGQGLHIAPGFVSSVGQSFRGLRGRQVRTAIEHTAPLPRGSSGGPLVDLDGQLIAVNSVRLHPGLVVAIPLGPGIAERVDGLLRGEAPRAVRLGVAVAPPRVARRLRAAVGLPDRDGVLVRAVQSDSPADRAGLNRGDLIVAAAGDPVQGLDDLYRALDRAASAGELALTILRGTDEHQVLVAFDSRG